MVKRHTHRWLTIDSPFTHRSLTCDPPLPPMCARCARHEGLPHMLHWKQAEEILRSGVCVEAEAVGATSDCREDAYMRRKVSGNHTTPTASTQTPTFGVLLRQVRMAAGLSQ